MTASGAPCPSCGKALRPGARFCGGCGATLAAACPACGLQYDDSKVIRSSVGVGLIWASPFGPLRFDYAVPLTKGKYDTVQQFRFGGGTSF